MARVHRADNVIELASPLTQELPPSLGSPTAEIADIKRRAYEIYEARGRADGADVDDWLRAERELLPGATSKAH